ncbi:DUF5995 family protein [Pseudonocardia sp.]|uniref:DUF5995 family protein n=1 Tax=Pseudonocardia sp. TaxID=60912 RepID=UPI00260931CE|nr:DUF5995 family protein [Pseudonocardia sp.]MCW2717525.1 hypothetical protein [Pseudonocardia sp.]
MTDQNPDDQSERDAARQLETATGDGTPTDIPDVLGRLRAVEACAVATSRRGRMDGIACFTRLYSVITARIDELDKTGDFHAPDDFLVGLDVAFAGRFFEAIRTWATNPEATPACWKVLFDRRQDVIPEANFAAAGVNAHINYDLSAALLETWQKCDPGDAEVRDQQRHDYEMINEVFAQEMDPLREEMHTFLSEGPDNAIWDRGADWIGDLVVRWTRAVAWDVAHEIWGSGDRGTAVARSDERLARMAGSFGAIVLKVPLLM